MAFDFPTNPLVGQEYTSGNVIYVWNGYGWVSQPIPDFVDVGGDTMTGPLKISMAGPNGHLILNQTTATDPVPVLFTKNNLGRWRIQVSGGAEPGGNQGSLLTFRRYDDSGTLLGDIPFQINRANGRAQVAQQPVDPLDVATKQYVDAMSGGGPGYLPLTGGTLSGVLYLPSMTINAPAGQNADLYGSVASSARWLIRLTDSFELHRYDNAGGYLGSPFQVNRLNGNANFSNALAAASFSSPTGTINTFNSDNATIGNCTSGGTFSLTTVSCNSLASNAITSYGTLTVNGNTYLQATATASLSVNGLLTLQALTGNPGFSNSIGFVSGDGHTWGMRANSAGTFDMGNQTTGGHAWFDQWGSFSPRGFMSKQGVDNGASGNIWNYAWTGSGLQCWIDSTDIGQVMIASDYRVKRDVNPLPSMWDKVKAMNPVSYKYKRYTPTEPYKWPPPAGPGAHVEPTVQPPAEAIRPLTEDDPDDAFRWGFIAHEVQEALTMDAASAYKDAPNAMQTLKHDAIIAALTKALQEAMTRIEHLELRLGIQR